MLKYNSMTTGDFRKRLAERLNFGHIDKKTHKMTTGYILKNAECLERLLEGLQMWTCDELEDDVSGEVFFLSLMKIMDLYRKNMDKGQGLAEYYLSRIDLPSMKDQTENRPWSYEQQSDLYAPLGGVYSRLIRMGVKKEAIDKYYLDGNLMEIYEDVLNVLPVLKNLCLTENPSPYDVREGVFVIETRFRKLYDRFFVEQFDGQTGVYGALGEVMTNLIKKGEEK